MFLIHSADIPGEYLEGLKSVIPGVIFVAIERSADVYSSIASHPDISAFAIDHDTLIVSPSIHAQLSAAFSGRGIHVIRSRSTPRGVYPETAVLNAVRIGPHILHNSKYTDTVIRDLARIRGLEIIHVNQGYTRCSVVNVAPGAIITGDRGIADVAEGLGVDVLLISPGSVLLPGEKEGFLGGASGNSPDRKVIFLGDLKRHPDHDAIDRFFRKHQTEYIDLPDLPLYDAGSLILLPSAS